MCPACASSKLAVVPSRPVLSPSARLADADAEVRAGCFDCLVSAFQQYNSLRAVASVADAATIGAARSAALLATRERELGTEDSGYLARAREIAGANAALQQTLGALLDIADTLPIRGGARQVSDDIDLRRNQTAVRNRQAWIEQLQT